MTAAQVGVCPAWCTETTRHDLHIQDFGLVADGEDRDVAISIDQFGADTSTQRVVIGAENFTASEARKAAQLLLQAADYIEAQRQP